MRMQLIALVLCAPAIGDVIDFESVPVGPLPDETLVVVLDDVTVIFKGPGLQIRQFDDPFPFTRVLSSQFDAGPIKAAFDGATADFVEIENIINGTYTGEVDVIDGTAFDAGGNILDFQSNADTIHHLEGPGIASVMYVENAPGQGFVLDNFAFEIGGGCYPDFNGDGNLDILDFVAFQVAFQKGDESADCDGNGVFNILDFVCFQLAFQEGC